MNTLSVSDDGAIALLNELRASGIRIQRSGDSLLIRGDRSRLTEELTRRIRQMKGELVAFLGAAGDIDDAGIGPRPADAGTVPLSFMQRYLWLTDRLEGSVHYNMASALRLEGRLDALSLGRALSAVVERHESLRTVFGIDRDGAPYPVVMKADRFALAEIDLTHLAGEAQTGEVERLSQAEAMRAFDLAGDYMMRSTLLHLGPGCWVLLNTMHHIASDGTSLDVLIGEMCRNYEALRRSEDSPLPPLELQYADHADWLSRWMTDARLERLLDYWQARLASLPAVHRWPTDRPRPRVRAIEGGRCVRRHSPEHADAIRTLCREHDVTPFMLMQAIFALLLSGWSGQRDIAMISPVSTRNRPEWAPLIGYFTNPVVLRSDCDPETGFVDFLRATKKTILDAHEHRHAPFELLVRRLNPVRSVDHHPLAQVSFMLLQGERASASGSIVLPDLIMTPLPEADRVAMKFDLELVLRDTPDGMIALWGYRSDLFDRQTIERLGDDFDALIGRVIAAPNCALSALLGPTPAERAPIPAQAPEPLGRAARPALARAPHSPEEQRMAALWSELLGESPRHVDADFFEQGGCSMHAVQLSVRLRERHGVEMPPRIVFEFPVLHDLAEWLRRQSCSEVEGQTPADLMASDVEETDPPARGARDGYTERTLVGIWASCLELPADAIGMDDSFFEIGGNSALSIAVQAEIIDALGVEVSIADMFQYPTIRHLARMIDGGDTPRRDRQAMLSDARSRMQRMRRRSKQ